MELKQTSIVFCTHLYRFILRSACRNGPCRAIVVYYFPRRIRGKQDKALAERNDKSHVNNEKRQDGKQRCAAVPIKCTWKLNERKF